MTATPRAAKCFVFRVRIVRPGIAGGCRDQNIGETGGSACPARLVREPAREARRIGCHGQNPLAIKMQHAFEP